MEKILFIVAHPDDAELAGGGTIKKFSSEGSPVRILNLTVSENTPATRNLRMDAARRAANTLGAELQWYKDGVYNQVEEIKMATLVGDIDALVLEFSPTKIFTHWEGDSHHDHILTSKAVIASSRKWTKTAIYFIPPNELKTINFTSFCPNTYVDISGHIDFKCEAIAEYNSFKGNIFRSLDVDDFKTASRFYGIASGCGYAEAFLLKKQVI